MSAGLLVGPAIRQVVKTETGNPVFAMVAALVASAIVPAAGHYLVDKD